MVTSTVATYPTAAHKSIQGRINRRPAGPIQVQSVSGYMTPSRTWSTVQVAGLLLTASSPHLQDLTNEMPSGDVVVCKQLNTALSCVLGQRKPPSHGIYC